MKPLVLFEFMIGLILFCEHTLSRHQISYACQFLLASIYNEMCLISVTDIKNGPKVCVAQNNDFKHFQIQFFLMIKQTQLMTIQDTNQDYIFHLTRCVKDSD